MDDAALDDTSERLAWEALCAYRMMAPTEHLLNTVRAAGAAEEETDGLEQQVFEGLGERAQAVLLRCVHDPVCVQLPPKAEYTQRVLKRAVQLAEAAGCEVCNELYEAACRSIATATESSMEELHFKTLAYTPAAVLGHLDTVERVATWRQRPGGGSDGDGAGARGRPDACTRLITLRVSSNYFAGDTGCRDWDAGTFLAELALSWPRLFAGRRVLELGAGVGLSAMCMLRHCAPARLTLTDGDATTLANLEHNLHLNDCAPTPPPEGAEQRPDGPTQAVGVATRVAGTVGHTVVECRRLLWGEGDATELHALRAEVVVGADIVYDPTSVPPLVSTLRTLLSAPPAEAVAADEPRPYALICTTMRQERTLDTFLDAVVAAGLSATDRTAALSPTRTFHYHSHVRRDEVRVHLLRAA